MFDVLELAAGVTLRPNPEYFSRHRAFYELRRGYMRYSNGASYPVRSWSVTMRISRSSAGLGMCLRVVAAAASLNRYLATLGSFRPQFPGLSPQSLVITNTGGMVAAKLARPTDPGDHTIVLGSNLVSQGVEAPKDVRILGPCPAPIAGASDFTGLYTARYVVPKAGTKGYVQVNQMVDAWESLPCELRARVPASFESSRTA